MSPGITVSPANLLTSTGRIFSAFHPIVTVENINETAGEDVLTNDQLNTVLAEFKRQGALDTLSKIFDAHVLYEPLKDYAVEVEQYAGVIVEVYGLTVAKMAMQMMLSSKRVNHTERNAKYSLLKVELEGFRDQNGILISRGVNSLLKAAIIDAQNIIFPQKPSIYGNPEW